MNEFERQVKANRQRADVQKMNKELQRSEEPLTYMGVPILLDGPSETVQTLNTSEEP